MKAAFVSNGPKVRIEDVPIPKPSANQVLIKVVVSGSNPKDWKVPQWMDGENHQGDDLAGVVHEVGSNVTEFKPGDRVAAMHEMLVPHGSYAEYAIAWDYATFHLPDKTSFEEGAAIPLAAMTAAIALYLPLGLPEPWRPVPADAAPTPLVVYGAASAVGAYALQFARRSNIHPLICVAGKSAPYVETLIDRSRGDTIIDYREGDEAVIEGLKKAGAESGAAGGLMYALDAISEGTSYENLGKVLAKGGKFTTVLPIKDTSNIPAHVQQELTMVSVPFKEAKDFGYVYFRYIARGLHEGWFKAQPQVVVPGGLGGVQRALEDLKAGRVNAVKYVFRIAETEGVGQ